MRLLVVNANTSELVTAKVAARARASAAPGTEIVPVTGSWGPRVIGTRAENAVAGHAALELMARHGAGCDAVVIAVSYDTALPAARELLPVPVVGMTEAGLLTACMLGGRIGIVVFGRRVLPMYQELVAAYGLASRVAGWRVLESTAAYTDATHEELDREIATCCADLVERDGAEVVLLTGAVMAGVPARIQAGVPVPVVDCIDCAVRQAELLVRLALPKPKTGSYALPTGRELRGVDPMLAAQFPTAPAP